MDKTDVLKYTLPTAKKFYILGIAALMGCIFTTKLQALEAKKNLPEWGRVFYSKTGPSIDQMLRKLSLVPQEMSRRPQLIVLFPTHCLGNFRQWAIVIAPLLSPNPIKAPHPTQI